MTVVWRRLEAATSDEIKLVQHEGDDRTIGYVLRIADHERSRSHYIRGEGWCEVLLRLRSGRQIKRCRRLIEWVEARRPDLIHRLNHDAWDFLGVLSEEREFRERSLERMVKRYGEETNSN